MMGIACFSQTENPKQKIKISGKVIDKANKNVNFILLLVNKSTNNGTVSSTTGDFTFYAEKSDTLLIGGIGYNTEKICFRDSALKSEYFVIIALKNYSAELNTVVIFPERELSEIEKDIDKLGYKESDYILSGVSAAQSPITFLYQLYSKRERSKRKAEELWNERNRRDLLKELLRKYVSGNIINLNDEEFDDFIDFCAISDDFMKQTSQYDFIMYIKKKFELYSMSKK